MNDCHVTNDKDYNVINNITYDQLICYQKSTNYSMSLFCIKQNMSNKTFNATIFLLILLSIMLFCWGDQKWLVYIPISLLLYLFVLKIFDSLNSITIKVADFKVGASEINENLMKKGYDKVLLKQYIVNTSNNSFGLVYIQNRTNRINDINELSVKIWPLTQLISYYKVIINHVKRMTIIKYLKRVWPILKRVWPISHLILYYKVISQYVKRINIIKTYYLKSCKTIDSYDDNDRCCISKLNSTANSIIEIHNKAIKIDRVVIFRNETPIYYIDAI